MKIQKFWASSFLVIVLLFMNDPSQAMGKRHRADKMRIILDSDANNELDDQHAIAYMLFSGDTFDVEGITVNRTHTGGDIHRQYAEAERVVRLCDLDSKIKLFKGADANFEEIKDHVSEERFDGKDAVDFMIERAHARSDRKLVILAVGKLTNVALAMHKDPSIQSKIRIVWLGSNYPKPGEYNQRADLASVNYVLDCEAEFEIALVRYGEPSGTAAVCAPYSEIQRRMPGKGPHVSTPVTGRHGDEFTCFGDYSINLFANIKLHGDPPSRALYDMAAVAILKNPSWATPITIPRPLLVDTKWVDRPDNPEKLILWEYFNREEIMKDFFNTMEHYRLVRN